MFTQFVSETATLRPVTAEGAKLGEDPHALRGVTGAPLADVYTAPRWLVQAAMWRLRAAADGVPPPTDLLARAGELFARGSVAGQTVDAYARQVALSTGLPVGVVLATVERLHSTLTAIDRLNRRDLLASSTGDPVSTVWTPAGRVFSWVSLYGKHPGTHEIWLRALALGYSVAIRPGPRDPFTPSRLVLALLQVGLCRDKIAFLPAADGMTDLLLGQADRAALFGPEDKVRPWRRAKGVSVHSTGTSKVLLDHDPDAMELDFLARSVADEAGVRCDNASVILTSRDPEALGARLAERLATLPVIPVTDPAARLPAVAADAAGGIRSLLRELSTDLTAHTPAPFAVDPVPALPDGSYAVRPVVLSATEWEHPAAGIELASPFVIVTSWQTTDGVAPLTRSLVLTLLAEAVAVPAVLAEPTITQVVVGPTLSWDVHPSVPDPRVALALAEPKRVLLSGVYDLEPVRRSYVNQALGMDAAEARSCSPPYHLPRRTPEVILARGAVETAEYQRQHALMAAALTGRGPVTDLVVAGRHHFDLPEDLGRRGTALGDAVLRQMRLDQ